MAKLRVFADRVSQPSRAVVIFCLANGIDAEEVKMELRKGDHKKPEYLSINPMGQVPAIDDDGFHLFESHAILRYLASAYPNVKKHWYPVDVQKRAEIDCILDWHHTNTRKGSAGLTFNRAVAPLFGYPVDLEKASECEAILNASLNTIETFWLKDEGPFLTGNSELSIADLSLACELMQLKTLGKEAVSKILEPCPKVKKWLGAVKESLSPHYEQVHEKLRTLVDMIVSQQKK